MHDDITDAVDRVRLIRGGRTLTEVYGRNSFIHSAFNADLKAIAYDAIDRLDSDARTSDKEENDGCKNDGSGLHVPSVERQGMRSNSVR